MALLCKNNCSPLNTLQTPICMPLVYQQNINYASGLGLWQIAESEDFFSAAVQPLHPIANEIKRLQHLSALYTLGLLHGDFPYSRVRVAGSGRPFVENDTCFFSISHSGSFAAALHSTEFRVGVDVENFHDRIFRVAPRFLSGPERDLLSRAAMPDSGLTQIKMLTAAWCVKEALYKWYGASGLDFIRHLHIDDFSVTDQKASAVCRIGRNGFTEAEAGIAFFDDCCLAWVVQ